MTTETTEKETVCAKVGLSSAKRGFERPHKGLSAAKSSRRRP